MEIIKASKEIVRTNGVKEISSSDNGKTFEVRGELVRIYKRRGRLLMSCSCINHRKFCKENPLCYHKASAIIFLSESKLNDKLKKIIQEYKKYKELKLPVSIDCMINDLEEIRYLK